jgi:hypothetical protein
MVRFDSGFAIGVLHQEIAFVLHHVSIWSWVSHVDVVVDGGRGPLARPGVNHPRDLAVVFSTIGDLAKDVLDLWSFLARILPPHYDVVLGDDHVLVEFNPAAKPQP